MPEFSAPARRYADNFHEGQDGPVKDSAPDHGQGPHEVLDE